MTSVLDHTKSIYNTSIVISDKSNKIDYIKILIKKVANMKTLKNYGPQIILFLLGNFTPFSQTICTLNVFMSLWEWYKLSVQKKSNT